MGLDFTISQRTDFRTDEKGRSCYTVTILGTLYNCSELVDTLNWRLEYGLSPCANYEIYCDTLWEVVNKIENTKEKEYVIEEFNKMGILNSDDKTYIVNASW